MMQRKPKGGEIVESWSLLVSILFFATSTSVISPLHAEEFDVKSASLQILWFTPVIVDPSPPPAVGKQYIRPHEKGLVLEKATMLPDGRIAFLGNLFDSPSYSTVLLTNAEQHGPEEITKLQLKGTQPELFEQPTFWEKIFSFKGNKPSDNPRVGSLAADGRDTIWVGGATHYYMGLASDPHSDVYLAKLDNSTKPLWERAYETGRVPFIAGMAPASTGDLVVVANDSWLAPSWLALIAANDGHLIWERQLGNGKGIAIVPTQGDRFIVASFDTEGGGATYQENVSIRTVSTDGQLGSATIIRQAINKDRGGHYGGLRMSATKDGAYVVSNWEVSFLSNPSLLQSAEIAKISAEGKLLWSKVLSDSFKLNTDRGGATFCSNPAVASLPDGDALVACALNGQIRLHKFDQNTGNDEQGSLPLPACNDDTHPVSLFLFVRKDGAVLLSGSRPSGNVGPGCSWMGRLTQIKVK